MKVTTERNQDAQRRVAELLEFIEDALMWAGEAAMIDETRYFYSVIDERLQSDINYLASNLRRHELPVWGYEPDDDGVDLWAN